MGAVIFDRFKQRQNLLAEKNRAAFDRRGAGDYVAVAVGGNAIFGYKQGDKVMVYALPK